MELRNSKAASGGDVTNWNGLELVLHPPKQIMCSEERWLLSSKQKTLVILWSSWITTHHKFHPFFFKHGQLDHWTIPNMNPSGISQPENHDRTQRHSNTATRCVACWKNSILNLSPGAPRMTQLFSSIKTHQNTSFCGLWMVGYLIEIVFGTQNVSKSPLKRKETDTFLEILPLQWLLDLFVKSNNYTDLQEGAPMDTKISCTEAKATCEHAKNSRLIADDLPVDFGDFSCMFGNKLTFTCLLIEWCKITFVSDYISKISRISQSYPDHIRISLLYCC